MSIATGWSTIRAALRPAPAVAATLRPAATEDAFERWADAVGVPLPPQLCELYAVHDGSSVTGGSGFNFVSGCYPLPIEKAIERFRRYDELTRLWGLPTAIPFTSDYSGCLLAVRSDGTGGVLMCFDDSPPMENYFADVEDLLNQTVEGLRGEHDEYRAELSAEYLLWINRDAEEDDLGYRV